jgi:hypothetical protein
MGLSWRHWKLAASLVTAMTANPDKEHPMQASANVAPAPSRRRNLLILILFTCGASLFGYYQGYSTAANRMPATLTIDCEPSQLS